VTQFDLVSITRKLLWVLDSRPEPEFRLAIINRLNQQLGEQPYPSLLKAMLMVAEGDDEPAKALLADTFAYAIDEMNLPTGSVSSWGASAGLPAYARRLGPIEFLTAWFSQPTDRTTLSRSGYQRTLVGLIKLFNCSAHARQLYPRWLQSEVESRQEGTYTKSTRDRLAAIARSWLDGLSAEAITEAAMTDQSLPSLGPAMVLRDL